MQRFALHHPRSLEEALALLQQHGSLARIYAGGQDLLYRLKKRLSSNPIHLINLKGVGGLDHLTYTDEDGLSLGPLVTIAAIASSPLIRRHFAALAQAAATVASPQIRNLATLGGNLCQDVWCWYLLENYDCWLNGGHYCYAVAGDNRNYFSVMGGKWCLAAHPSDLAPALMALRASVTVTRPQGSITLPVEELWPGFTRVNGRIQPHSLSHDALITAVHLPTPEAGSHSLYLKARLRGCWDFAQASVAAALVLEEGVCRQAEVILGGIATQPYRAQEVTRVIVGERLRGAILDRASQVALDRSRPLSMNGYKVDLARGLIKRILGGLAASGAKPGDADLHE